LLEFARAHGAVILEDDYDGEYRFGARPLDALQTLDRDGIVFYIGTFSKSLFPGLRKGFVVAPPWAFEALVAVKTCVDAHSDEVAQAVLAAFIREGHLARHVRRMRGIYAARRAALLEGLGTLSPWLTPIPSEAGMHLAARLRSPDQAAKVFEIARDCTPGAASSAMYAMTPSADPVIAFGYGVIDAEDIPREMARFRQRAERELGPFDGS
jgi:GntR family transcriptional regulator/MocR family aminotransferase